MSALGGGGVTRVLKDPNSRKMERVKQAEASIERAQKTLKKMGIDTSDLKIEVTDRLDAEGGKPLAPDTIGVSSNYSNRIQMNVQNDYYSRVYENQSALHKKGMLSSKHKDHAITHEIAHQEHRKVEAKLGVWDKKSGEHWSSHETGGMGGMEKVRVMRKTARKVSRYADDSPKEFVAETFAGRVAGVKFPADVQALYKDLNGPHADKLFGGD
jgi:hypothetical protein